MRFRIEMSAESGNRHSPKTQNDNDDEDHFYQTPFSTVSRTKEKHTAKIPDPPILTDSITPSFDSWKFQMLNKFETNSDYYYRPTCAAEEAAKIGYAVTRIQDEAADHFFSWKRAKRRAGEASMA
jgi:hypothetical protein